MIEVIVGIVITALFIGILMQFLGFSSLLKGRSQQNSEEPTFGRAGAKTMVLLNETELCAA